jgi:hypothetical protein
MDGQFAEERYKVVIFYNHNMYSSNELVFTNLNPAASKELIDELATISITHGENSRDDYQLYGTNNYLLNVADGYRKRYLIANYSSKDSSNDNSPLNGA